MQLPAQSVDLIGVNLLVLPAVLTPTGRNFLRFLYSPAPSGK